jgi:hypothetical protein
LPAELAAMGKAIAPAHFAFGARSIPMAIYRLLQQSAFTPDDIHRLVSAHEDCLRALNIADRSDPISERLAKTIIEIAQTGLRDPAQIRARALKEIEAP